MENFEYYNPVKVIFGSGKLSEVGPEASKLGKKALIVSYINVSFLQSAIDRLHSSLAESHVGYVDFFEVTANPLLSQARLGSELCHSHDIDLVIALGGGSVMDCAKLIAAGALYAQDISKMIMFSHSEITAIPPKNALPTIMIPTLPATGSEMNATAVVTDDETRKKSYVWEPSCLYAKTAIMDPELIVTLPLYQTACGVFDIVAHIAEAYLNAECGGEIDYSIQDGMQLGVIRAVLTTLPKLAENPSDLQLRGVTLWAASIGLNGWLTSGTFGLTPMHQMGHVLSGRYNATHGATLACMMPAWMRFFAKRTDNERYRLFAENIFGTSDISSAADRFEEMMRKYGVQTRISEFGVVRDEIPSLAQTVAEVSFLPNGKLFGRPQLALEEIEKIYNIAF